MYISDTGRFAVAVRGSNFNITEGKKGSSYFKCLEHTRLKKITDMSLV